MNPRNGRLRPEAKWLRRFGWLIALWLGGVAAAIGVAAALKLILRAVT